MAIGDKENRMNQEMEKGMMTTILKIQETRGNEQIFEETDLSRNANRKVTGKWCKEYTHTHIYIYIHTSYISIQRYLYNLDTKFSTKTMLQSENYNS